MGHTLTVLLHAAGGMLLLCAGMGCGFTAAAHIRDCQRQLHSLSRLFGYLAELLNAQALAGPELLHRAARCPEFADFCPAGAAALADLQLPSCLPEALRGPFEEAIAGRTDGRARCTLVDGA